MKSKNDDIVSECDSCDESDDDQNLDIHEAKYITDQNGYVYDEKVLKLLKVDDVVRISYKAHVDYKWSHDSPYLKIIKISKDEVLGEILDIKRYVSDMYPINIGDSIWFSKENIIEIPLNRPPNNIRINQFMKHITETKLMCTGPLCTIYESYSDSDSDSDDDKKEVFSDVSSE
ncbi:MAG: hypothetical protein ACRCZI_08385 [Cetobacterium sp.]